MTRKPKGKILTVNLKSGKGSASKLFSAVGLSLSTHSVQPGMHLSSVSDISVGAGVVHGLPVHIFLNREQELKKRRHKIIEAT